MNLSYSKDAVSKIKRINGRWLTLAFVSFIISTSLMATVSYNVFAQAVSSSGSGATGTTLPSDDTFSLVPVSKAVTKQTCQLSGSKGWSCRMTTTHVQPPPLGSATVYLEWGGSEIRLGSITGSGMINNIPRDTDIKIIVSGGFHPITESIHTPLSQINYVYVCTVDGCSFTPSAPQNLQATAGIGNVTLHWQVPSSDGGSATTGYKIYRSSSSGTEGYLTTLGSVTSYTDTGLARGHTYFYKITAVNYIGTSPESNEASATTPTIPSAPQNLQATAGIGNVTLSWQVPSSNGGSPITGYKIYRSSSSGTEGYLTTVGNVTSYTYTRLASGHTYFYKITAVNSIGTSRTTNDASATTFTIPSAPQNLKATSSSSSVTLSWHAPSSDGGSPITGYKIYRSSSSGTEGYLVTVGNVTSYTDTGLASGHTYFYKITAVNSIGTSRATNDASATTFTIPSAPQNLKATAHIGNVTLSWH